MLKLLLTLGFFFFSSRRRHTRSYGDWSSDVCFPIWFAAGTYTSEIGPGCGFFTLANTILRRGTEQQAEYFNELQKIALTQTRLKVPLLEDRSEERRVGKQIESRRAERHAG